MRRTWITCLAVAAAACASEAVYEDAAAARKLEFIELPISQLDELPDGIVAIALRPMSRSFVIHPEYSPDHEALITFAKEANGSGRRIHATAWIRATLAKNEPSDERPKWPFIIVRLADTRDPRSSEKR